MKAKIQIFGADGNVVETTVEGEKVVHGEAYSEHRRRDMVYVYDSAGRIIEKVSLPHNVAFTIAIEGGEEPPKMRAGWGGGL